MAYIGIVSATDTEQLSPNYIGFQPTVQRPESSFVVDTFTGNNVQTVFPLSSPKPVSSRALLVSVNGALLVPVTDYNLDGTGNIEFVSAPSAGAYITVHHLIFPKNEATTTIRKLDDISSQFDGTTTQFTLTANGVAADIIGQNVLIISIDGVIQEPGSAYTMNGDDIIFSEAPQNISSFYGVDIGTTGIGTPSDATVSTEKLLTSNNGSAGQVLSIDSNGSLVWTTLTDGSSTGALNLDGLSDVAVSSPLAGQTLIYNGSAFVNSQLSYSDIANRPSLSTVATTGSYNDLTNKPVIPTDVDDLTDVGNLLFAGSYNDLTDRPAIPSTVDELGDVDIQTPAANQVLIYDGANWINDNLELTDLVGIVDGTSGQVLTTDGNGGFTFTTVSGAGTATILTSTNSVGNEGGEINLAASENATISGVIIDSYNDVVRIFEDGGTSRGVSIDLSKAPAGVGGDLMWKASGIVNAGTFVTLDLLKAAVTTSGNRGLSLASTTGSFNILIGGNYALVNSSVGGDAGPITITTTPSSSIFSWNFTASGDISTYIITDTTNSRAYRITLQIGASYNNNFICIERLY